jgi:hypothetical protein
MHKVQRIVDSTAPWGSPAGWGDYVSIRIYIKGVPGVKVTTS